MKVKDSKSPFETETSSEEDFNAESRNKPTKRSRRNLVPLKLAVFSCIMVAAAVVGYGSYDVIRTYELHQFEQEYRNLMKYLIPAFTAGSFDFSKATFSIS
jgi:hypothetical protein